MEMIKTKYIIIGAGLSGLTTAYQLHKSGETDFMVLESRDRIGGRILTKDHVDFGATWFQGHHEQVHSILDELGIDRFLQYSTGQSVLVYNTMAPAHYFENDPNTVPASRISGGSSALIEALGKPVFDKVHLNRTVTEITNHESGINLLASAQIYQAEKVIVTIPPRIATRIVFSPSLPQSITEVMENTHTWMSNAIKLGMTFKEPFWRNKNLSGTLIGQVGPMVELYDHTDEKEAYFTLMGFVNEALRDSTLEERKSKILDYLATYLGEEVRDHLTYEEKDWSEDVHTSCETIKSFYMSPQYGHPVFQEAYMNGRLFFSGAETSPYLWRLYGGCGT